MTIVKEEMMNTNQNLEAELEEDPELNDAYDDADYEVEDGDSPSDEGRPLAGIYRHPLATLRHGIKRKFRNSRVGYYQQPSTPNHDEDPPVPQKNHE